jgi:hypothetical protein
MTTNPLGWGASTERNILFGLALDAPVVVVADTFDTNCRHFPMMGGAKADVSGRHRFLLPATGHLDGASVYTADRRQSTSSNLSSIVDELGARPLTV